ncbi:sulfatase-like protein [Phytophthora cinnamomi]|nr:sulfatase-like protein [Phytophthora cinnamomi]
MQLGKFMDRMEAEGVLNDTIVVIFGDHGRGPEVYNSDHRDVSVTRVPTTIVAEGRLGAYAGLMVDDVAEHYDLLNTLADITGVPEGGFVQDGVGRSLKRKAARERHVVFSNNPSRKMSVVRGHQRLQYDRVADSVLLHHVDADHDMQVDLFPNLTADEQAEWLAWRDVGRDISRYYLQRWDGKCLLAVNCTQV